MSKIKITLFIITLGIVLGATLYLYIQYHTEKINSQPAIITSGKTLTTNDEDNSYIVGENTLSGRCGYEYFYKKKEGDYTRLNKLDFTKDESPIEGVPYKVFWESLSRWDDVSKKTIEPAAKVLAVIYTDSCKNGTSSPTYYYNGGKEENPIPKKEVEGGLSGFPALEIIKGTTFTDVTETFSNPTAKLMGCILTPNFTSAEILHKSKILIYTLITATGRGESLSEDQKNYVVSKGSKVVPLENDSSLYVETTRDLYADDPVYDSHNDCGNDTNRFTRFYESLDIPNVFIRTEKSQEVSFWGEIVIVK